MSKNRRNDSYEIKWYEKYAKRDNVKEFSL